MGEAKRRGTYEERKALAIERDKKRPKRVNPQLHSGKELIQLLTLFGMMSGYNPFRLNK